MAVLGLIWAPKTAIFYLNHERIWRVENGKTPFFHFAIEQWDKTFRMHCFTAPGDTMRLLERVLKIGDFWNFLINFKSEKKSAKIRIFHMINYFAILRLNFLRDNQMSYKNLENGFRNRAIGNFRKKKNFENWTNIRDSSALWSYDLS